MSQFLAEQRNRGADHIVTTVGDEDVVLDANAAEIERLIDALPGDVIAVLIRSACRRRRAGSRTSAVHRRSRVSPSGEHRAIPCPERNSRSLRAALL
jgi:hypothetical protein